jgi:putative ABC transport system permease protein
LDESLVQGKVNCPLFFCLPPILLLLEATLLAFLGGALGFLIGAGGAWLIGALVPALPTRTAWGFVLLAELAAVLIGLAAGVLPPLRAAALNPVAALHEE